LFSGTAIVRFCFANIFASLLMLNANDGLMIGSKFPTINNNSATTPHLTDSLYYSLHEEYNTNRLFYYLLTFLMQ